MAKNNYQIYVNPQETNEPDKEQSYYQWEITPDNIIAFQDNVKSGQNPDQLPLHYVQSPEDVQNNRIRMTMYPNKGDTEFVLPVASKKPAGFIDRALQYINDEVLLNKDNVRIKNYSKAMDRNPEFTQNNDMASNIGEFVNTMTVGIPQLLSLTHDARMIYDLYKGGINSINPLDLNSSWYRNNGIFPDKFAEQHPILTVLGNLALDGGFYKGANKFYKWGTTPKLVGSGAESEVFSAPFSNHVIKYSSIPPSDMARMNRIPGFAKCKFMGIADDGRYIYKQEKLIFPKNPVKELNSLSKDMVKHGYKMFHHSNVQGPFFISKFRDSVWNDLGINGKDQVGITRIFRRPRFADGALDNISDFNELVLQKKGGKLNANNSKR